MPDEKDISLLPWHLGFLKFHYLFSSSGFIFRKIEQSWSTFLNTSLLLSKIHYTPGVKLPVPSNAVFPSASWFFSACLQIITRSLIAADQEAPPWNRRTISLDSIVCRRKGSVGSSDPDLSVLFEFAQLKQGPKMGVAPLWFFSLWREKTQCVQTRERHRGFHFHCTLWF